MSFPGGQVEEILAGRKTAEVRKRRPGFLPGTRVWMYQLEPRGDVVGWFVAGEAVEFDLADPPGPLMERAMVEPDDLDEFASDAATAWAIPILESGTVEPGVPLDRGPAAYRYLRPEESAEDRRLLRAFHKASALSPQAQP